MNPGKPDEAQSQVSRAVAAVGAMIRNQRLRVGDDLPGEGYFAADLGVSRAVMREAFVALAALEVIDVGNGRRPRVGAVSGLALASSLGHAMNTTQMTVLQVWDVRRTLELRTAALAALHRSDSEAARLLELGHLIRDATPASPVLIEHDIALHQLIATASRNLLFEQIIASFGQLMHDTVPMAWSTRRRPDERAATLQRHLDLAQSISDRNADAAVAAMDAHFDSAVVALLSAGVT